MIDWTAEFFETVTMEKEVEVVEAVSEEDHDDDSDLELNVMSTFNASAVVPFGCNHPSFLSESVGLHSIKSPKFRTDILNSFRNSPGMLCSGSSTNACLLCMCIICSVTVQRCISNLQLEAILLCKYFDESVDMQNKY